MRKILILLSTLVVACGSDEKGGSNVLPESKVLKDKAKYAIGAAIKSSLFSESAYTSALTTHFSQVTAEWEMKMEPIWAGHNQYKWDGADKIINFASANDLKVHGHTLLWHRSWPQWFKSAKYDSAAFESAVKQYIQATTLRYKGKVVSWDVANEIFNDNGTLRSTDCPVFATFKDPIGFYGRCFRYVNEMDPDAILFYNDYNVVTASNKRAAIKRMITRFQKEGVPIQGIGDQFHYKVTTDKNAIKTGLADLGSTGLMVHISELDIVVNTAQSEGYEFSGNEAIKQAEMYQYIAESFESLPAAQKFGISLWGVSDKDSWLRSDWHHKEYPLLFDDYYKEKQAYKGLLSGIKQ